jgi:hypothetical protein
MDGDDATQPKFASWDRYQWFSREVLHSRRYVWGAEIAAFLDTVLATIRDRDVTLRKGMILYRAQLGIDWVELNENAGSEPSGYDAKRMKPRPYRAMEGRANPAGVPVLYLGTTERTAISEIRPWVGAAASVAQFKLLRPLKALDLSRGHGQSSLAGIGFRHFIGGTEPTSEEKERAVWIDIDNAFSRPVTKSDDTADYAPTQILAELFREAGYDAVAYKSQFGEKGFNVAVFNVADADPINCAPYEVTEIDVKFREIGNRWFSTKHSKPSSD